MADYRTALVTGASRGLGKSLAQQLAKRGLSTLLVGRDWAALEAVAGQIRAQGGRAETYAGDLNQPERRSALLLHAQNTLGTVDLLVNNAAVGWYKPLLSCSEAELTATIQTNLLAPILLTRQFLPGMVQQKRGLIINIASDLARRYLPNMATYVASKFGLLGFSGSLLREVKGQGVKVVTVLPGLIDTTFGDRPTTGIPPEAALPPDDLAATITGLLDLPDHLLMDEWTIHPPQQDF